MPRIEILLDLRMSNLGNGSYRGSSFPQLIFFSLLVISTGLGVVSLGSTQGGYIRIWEVSLAALVVVIGLRLVSKRKIVLLVSPTLVFVAGYFVAVLVSGLNAFDPAMWLRRSTLVLAMIVLFFVCSQRDTRREFDIYFKLTICSGVCFAIIGVMDVYLFPRNSEIFRIIHQFDGGQQFAVYGIGGLAEYEQVVRARGFFTESNEFSQYLITPFGFLLAIAFFKTNISNTWLPFRFGIFIVLWAQIVSLSRGGLLGFFVELVGLFLVKQISGSKWNIGVKNYMPIAVLILLILISGGFIISEYLSPVFFTVLERITSTGTSDDWTMGIRLMNYRYGFLSVSESPENFLIGVGVGNSFWSHVREATTSNQFLDVLVETGIIGLVLYLLIIFSLLSESYKFMKNKKLTSDNNVFIVFVGSFLSFLGMLVAGMTYSTHMLFFFWLNAGLLLAVCKYRGCKTPKKSPLKKVYVSTIDPR